LQFATVYWYSVHKLYNHILFWLWARVYSWGIINLCRKVDVITNKHCDKHKLCSCNKLKTCLFTVYATTDWQHKSQLSIILNLTNNKLTTCNFESIFTVVNTHAEIWKQHKYFKDWKFLQNNHCFATVNFYNIAVMAVSIKPWNCLCNWILDWIHT